MISHKHKFIFVHIPKTGGCSIEGAFGVDFMFSNPEQPDDRRHRRLNNYKRLFPDEYARYFKFCFVRNPWDRTVSYYHGERLVFDLKLGRHPDDPERVAPRPGAAVERFPDAFSADADAAGANQGVAVLETLEDFQLELEVRRQMEREAQARAAERKLARIRGRAEQAASMSFREFVFAPTGNVFKSQLASSPLHEFDFIGRFESFARHFALVCDRLGVRVNLPHLNQSRHEHYTTYYDKETRQLVAECCAGDIRRFGYRFGE